MIITDIKQEYVKDIATLHIQGISAGFISSLGIDFVTALYEGIAKSKSSFGFEAIENKKVVGFITFTTNLNKLYRSIVVRKSMRFVLLLAGKTFSLNQIRKVLETLFYPRRTKKMNLPSAELLSIVVAEEARGKGLATTLMQKGLAECAERGVESVKVLVGADNEPANRLYVKCGFELTSQVDNHGILSNVYVAKTEGRKD